jgi:hypothetical protein
VNVVNADLSRVEGGIALCSEGNKVFLFRTCGCGGCVNWQDKRILDDVDFVVWQLGQVSVVTVSSAKVKDVRRARFDYSKLVVWRLTKRRKKSYWK